MDRFRFLALQITNNRTKKNHARPSGQLSTKYHNRLTIQRIR